MSDAKARQLDAKARQLIEDIVDAGARDNEGIRHVLEDGEALRELGIGDADIEAVEEAHYIVVNNLPNEYWALTDDLMVPIAQIMDTEIRERLQSARTWTHPGEFLTAYMKADPDFPINQFATEPAD